MKSNKIDEISWHISRLSEAMELLARRSGLLSQQAEPFSYSEGLPLDDEESISSWIRSWSARMGVEAEQVDCAYPEVDKLIRNSAPALLCVHGKESPRFLAVLSTGRLVSVLGPDLKVHKLKVEDVRSAICSELESPIMGEVDQLLESASIPLRRREKSRKAILMERLRPSRIGGHLLLRLPPSAGFWKQMAQYRLLRHLSGLIASQVIQYILWVLSWWMLGLGALQGRFDRGWLLAWLLMLVAIVPFRMIGLWSQGILSIGAGAILKQRLLYGALKLDPDEIRHQGSGQLLGQVMESEAVESLALSGGFTALIACIELVISGIVLSLGAGGWFHSFLLLVWLALVFFIGRRYFQHRWNWTISRLDMTNDLIERMVGHRTRLAQEMRENWHDGEDSMVDGYLSLSKKMDRSAVLLQAFVPRGWLILGLLGIAVPFVSGQVFPGLIAVSLGGIIMAYRALSGLSNGLSSLADAIIAWKKIAHLYLSAESPGIIGSPELSLAKKKSHESEYSQTLLEAHDLTFRYHGRGDAVLQNCNIKIYIKDRILLEGPSGCGKSTLASLITGLRSPESGLILLDGLDRQSLGDEGWRQLVTTAPQFHENHVFTGTFAFNLLMGRRWPPFPKDLQDAEDICQELGLKDVLEKMPAGLLQTVGETGWQLSHGEKSRLYIARALLQGAELIVLDESFAALDPENLQRALRCVLDRAPALLVIAHP